MSLTPQPWAPVQTSQQELLPEQPNHPFFYKWHPTNWTYNYFEKEVTKGKTKKIERSFYFVPNIRMEHIIPGVNGVHQVSGERGNPGSRIGNLQQKGWIYLDPGKHQYIHQYRVRNGFYHCPKWQSVRVVGNRVIKSFDREAFLKWSCSLITDGTLLPIEPHFWELESLTHLKAVNRMLNSQHIPEIKAKIDDHYKVREDMLSFIEAFQQKGIELYKEIK
tara:strand:+ start:1283 stop:1942 length:660 start_codon:yes stop_codon:yes gene_type:complete